ncbi:MAG: exodeoxyribonuclease VII large subunit [Bacteroidales bacterium]
MQEKTVFTLSKVTKAIQNVIATHCNRSMWVKAEIVKLNYYMHSGHCYPDLVEKKDNRIIAEMRGNIWRRDFEAINARFKSVLNEPLGDNMTVVFRATVKYHPVYGLSLNISDIDPHFTLGELAKQKAETVQRLKAEDIFFNNKNTQLPLIPKVLAIISVSTSKGYQDFVNVIDNNAWNYRYHYLLFPAVLQGDRAVQTIREQLQKIKTYKNVFDAVAIIRGGGGDVGLSCYDNYALAKEIAGFPIPVLSGIGHSTNETVSELVSYKNFITPTKIAEFLIQQYHEFSVPLKENWEKLTQQAFQLMDAQQAELGSTARLFRSVSTGIFEQQRSLLKQNVLIIKNKAKTILANENSELKAYAGAIQYGTSRFIQSQRHELAEMIIRLRSTHQKIAYHERQNLNQTQKALQRNFNALHGKASQDLEFTEQKINMLKPENILKRGFSITRVNGKALCKGNEIIHGDIMETELFKGIVRSRVEQIKSKN